MSTPAPPDQPPLTGITVLEVGVFMAAPYAAMQLADLGARVVKVEDPRSGDPVRASGPFVDGESSPYLRLNRNKESVALDLKSAAGKQAFLDLVASADVVIENLRPGAMARLGLDAEAIWAVNPRVVHASGSGWGQDGPLAPLPGLDIMAQARSGIMSITGTPGGEPVKVGVPVCDLVCGLYLALAVTAALRERDRTGVGQSIDVSLFEAGVSLAVWEAGKWFATGEVGGPLGSAHQSQAPYQAFQTADGWVTIGANTPNTWAGLCATLDMADELADPGYADASRRHARRGELLDVVESRTRARTTADLLAALGAAGVPCAPINDYGEVFTDEHLNAREFFWDAPHPTLGPVRQIGSPMRFSRTPAVRGVAGPPLGADTRAVLTRYGVPADVVDAVIPSSREDDA
ncbi:MULTISPECIES: CaiB/BaiF CoA transferase family protein [unclassified Modestobacter]|uniref:CaiB/BaiF CoA transferase family protein n=1 Tax=unclassified Modestobacter TaxID=2643866 RepID=UPI0022AB3EE1|nr:MULTISPECIES: CoA transferase [unclassified Modestobacter]MCZ2811315.1 CoA transferase [Modestobacter sp. VKM Ac-2979]MCZ2840828.1 CoA transferase [Modestobacter sp. VKM Ac-2980]MCZ2848113.1 CoA transferase [Modestobacter sp. VKM Ac-2978]